MCGIVGIWAPDISKDRIQRETNEAVARLHHRGPDDHGIWMNDSGLSMGHARLSILDLSRFGHQPMVTTDGRNVIVFNGEIYNFADIRRRLELAGHTFAGTGDTEIILHAFRQWGSSAVEQFIGMFAIAYWDQAEQTLELLRDRIGVKPLYFGWHGGTLCFASELKALRAFTHWSPRLDQNALGEFLQYGFIAGDRTIYQGVFKLLPGHRLRLKPRQQPIVDRYWSLLSAIATPLSGTDQEIEEQLEDLLIGACRYRMVSDVPVGVYLSGGVDSSLVTAILAKHYDRHLSTFTIGFQEDSHDESRWARQVAQHCGTAHSEYILGEREALAIARGWGGLFDEPFGDSSAIPTLLVSRMASRQVKVVLSADGGDELFSGYSSYNSVLDRLQRLQRLPVTLRLTAAAALTVAMSTWPARSSRRRAFYRRAYRWHAMLRQSTPGRLIDLDMSYWNPPDICRLIGDYQPSRSSADAYPADPATQISLWDFHYYLPEDILTKVDRTTMAASIEGREPLLDHRLAEFAFRLPLHLRRGPLGPKHILKSILHRYVPRKLVDRPKKGFSIPLENWLRNDLRTLVHEYLSPDRIRAAGIIDPTMVQQLLCDFYKDNRKLTTQLWFILAFEMWREQWA